MMSMWGCAIPSRGAAHWGLCIHSTGWFISPFRVNSGTVLSRTFCLVKGAEEAAASCSARWSVASLTELHICGGTRDHISVNISERQKGPRAPECTDSYGGKYCNTSGWRLCLWDRSAMYKLPPSLWSPPKFSTCLWNCGAQAVLQREAWPAGCNRRPHHEMPLNCACYPF